MSRKIIIRYEIFILFVLSIKKDILIFFKKNSFIRYFRYKIKYPYLSIPTSSTIEGNVTLELNVHIKPNVVLSGNILVGRNTSFNDNCKFFGDIEIGDNCLIAFNVFASTSKHNFKEKPYLSINEQDELNKLYKKIIIEDDCWIGINVAIMQGVKIGKGTVIGSNSVVTKSIEPYSIVVGANKIIGKRLDFNPPKKISYREKRDLPYFYKGFLVRSYEQLRYKVNEGLLSKRKFELKLNIEEETFLYLEVKKYMKDSILYFEQYRFEINSNEFSLIKIPINNQSILSFYATESIIVASAYLK